MRALSIPWDPDPLPLGFFLGFGSQIFLFSEEVALRNTTPLRLAMNGKADEAASRSPSAVPFATAASRVAVAQICLSVGYAGAEAPALRALADVAGRYLHALGRSAAASAGARGRTDANLFDVVRAMEDLGCGRGFAGASDPTSPLLRSTVLRDLMAFVGSVDEIPFPKPIRREMERRNWGASSSPSFAETAREPPFWHVPRWLPCFPAERGGKSEEQMTTSDGGEEERKEERVETPLRLGEGKEGVLPADRKAVRFPLGLGKKTTTNGRLREDGKEGQTGGKRRR